MAEKALAEVKVLEYCELAAGPYCAKLLADLGAEVVKLEEPRAGDEARRKGPFLNDIPHPERSGLFLYCNTNKLGITLNIETANGKKLFKQLVKEADILVEDKPPGKMKKLGLDYESLKALNPRLVMTSITPFGQTGPYKDFKAYALNIDHAGGEGYQMPGQSPWPDREPVKGPGYSVDFDSGLSAAIATLGALYARYSIGTGQHVDVSRQEAAMTMERAVIPQTPNDGVKFRRYTEKKNAGIPPCKDGYVLLVTGEDRQWTALVDLMGNPEWAKDEKFKDRSSRFQNDDELGSHIRGWLKEHNRHEVFMEAQKRGLPAGIAFTLDDLFNDPQIKEREFFAELDHPEAGKLKYPTVAYKFSETPWSGERSAPLLGQHNEEIYCQRLGYTKQELAAMRQAGII